MATTKITQCLHPGLSLCLRSSQVSRIALSITFTRPCLVTPIRTMSSATQPTAPRFSAGSDEASLSSRLSELLPSHGRWTLTASGEGIQRLVRFKTFKNAWAFMDRVAQDCRTARHHPEWANTYNTVFVRWTTHNPRGLSEKDVTMAMLCDEHAAELGEVIEEGDIGAGGSGEGLLGLVNDVSKSAGDCCTPKKKLTA